MWSLTPIAVEDAIATLEATAAHTPTPTPVAAPEDAEAPAAHAAPELEPAECMELISNGSFDDGNVGWNFNESVSPPAVTDDVFFGDSGQSLRLGIADGDNVASISAADQTVDLPAEATSIVLSLRYYPLYDEEPGPGDLQYIDIYNAMTGQFAGRVVGAQLNDRRWLGATYDLTPLSGQAIRVVFAVNNDGVAGATAAYIDDVSILACNYDATPTPDSSVQPETTPATQEDADETQPPASEDEQSGAEATPSVETSLAGEDTTALSGARVWLARMFTGAVMFGVLAAIGAAAIVIMNSTNSPDKPKAG
jgi:hypothetical protein